MKSHGEPCNVVSLGLIVKFHGEPCDVVSLRLIMKSHGEPCDFCFLVILFFFIIWGTLWWISFKKFLD